MVFFAPPANPRPQHTLEKKPRPGRENPLGGDELPNLTPRRAEPDIAKPKPATKRKVAPVAEPKETPKPVAKRKAAAKILSKKPVSEKEPEAKPQTKTRAEKADTKKSAPEEKKKDSDKKPPKIKKKRSWIKRLLIWGPTTLVVLVLLLAATLYFAGDKVFKAVWPMVDKKLAAKGIYVDIGSVDQTRERGLILSDVVLYKDAGRTDPFATLSDIGVKPKFFQGDRGKIAGQITFEESDIQLLTGDTDPALLGTRGEIVAGTKGVILDGFETHHKGLVVAVAGEMQWSTLKSDAVESEPEPETAPEPEPETVEEELEEKLDLAAIDLSGVDEVVRWLHFEEASPFRLNVQLSPTGDDETDIELDLLGKDFVWKGVAMRQFELDARSRLDGDVSDIEVRSLRVGYREGKLNAGGHLDLTESLLTLTEVTSDIDLLAMAVEVHPPLQDIANLVTYRKAPVFKLAGVVSLAGEGRGDLDGEIDLGGGLAIHSGGRTTEFEALSSKIHIKDGTVFAKDLQLGIYGGIVTANIDARLLDEALPFHVALATERPIPVAALAEYLGVPSKAEGALDLELQSSGNLEAFEVPKLVVTHGDESLSGDIDVDLKGGSARIAKLESDLDLVELLRELVPGMRDKLELIVASDGPDLDVAGNVVFENPAASDLVVGIVTNERWELQGESGKLIVEELATTVTLRDKEVSTDDLRLRGPTSEIKGALAVRPFGDDFSMRGELSTPAGVPLASLSKFFGAPSDTDELLTLDVQWSGDLQKIDVPKLAIGQGEKSLDAVLDLDLGGGIVNIASLKSDIDFVELSRGLVAASREPLSIITSSSGPALDGSGVLHYKDLPASDLQMKITSEKGFVLDINGQPLALDGVNSTVVMKGGTVSSDDFRVGVLGGQVLANVASQPFDDVVPFQAALLVDSLSMQEIMILAGTDKKDEGSVSLNFQGSGSTLPEHLQGAGEIDAKFAEIYAFPMFGEVFHVVNNLGVGLFDLGRKEAGYARGKFVVDRGVFNTDDIRLSTGQMDAEIPGRIDLVKSEMDVDVNVTQKGLVGLAANSVAAVQVKVAGPFDNLEIKPGLQGGIAGTAGALLEGSVGAAGDIVGDTAGVAGDLVGGTVGAAGNLVGGALGMQKKKGEQTSPGAAPRAEAVSPPEEKPKKRGFFDRLKRNKK